MWINLLLACIAFSSGLMVAMGVFSVLIAISLLPRLAGKTNTAKYILLYENMIILGIIVGVILSVFPASCTKLWTSFQTNLEAYLSLITKNTTVFYTLWHIFLQFVLLFYGLFTGIFVGTLAIAIAELLDAIPIFARRANLKNYLNLSIFFMAFGKFAGAIFAFITGI